jgi:hypothetical protein
VAVVTVYAETGFWFNDWHILRSAFSSLRCPLSLARLLALYRAPNYNPLRPRAVRGNWGARNSSADRKITLHTIAGGGKVEAPQGANTGGRVVRSLFILGTVIFALCSCADMRPDLKSEDKIMVSGVQESVKPSCDNRNVMQTRTRRHYQDYCGTMITTNPSALTTDKTTYLWGITNQTPLDLTYFAAYLKPMGRFSHFNAKLYIDSGIKDSMIFFFRNGDKEGEVLKSVPINPGQTVGVDFEISGVKKMYVGSELRTNHGRAAKIVMGEPEFYNCR